MSDEAVREIRALLDAAVDAIVIIDAEERIIEFSAAAQRMFGYRLDEVVGKPVSLLMPEPHRSRHSEYIERYLRTGQAHIIGIGREVEALTSDGALLPVALSVGEFKTGTGKRHFVAILRDLSAQKRAEAETRAAQNRLAHVGRFSLMGEMVAGIAHELNQPLAAIVTYAQAGKRLLAKSAEPNVELDSICDRIAQQAERASEVLARLRDFIRKQEPRKSLVAVPDVYESIRDLVEADAHVEGIDIRFDSGSELPRIEADPIQLQQVLINLTHNAVDAMKGGTRKNEGIDIRIDRAKGDRDGVVISVTDHGHGIPPELRDSVFHPFVTTKQEGLGVGLAISQTIIRAHGGEITCHENRGGGTIFTVFLPAAASRE